MIKGSVEIVQTYKGKDISLFREDNMAVDGLRKTIADVMTFMPNPSGNSTGEGVRHWNGVSSVSSYQVQAMSLGSAKDYYTKRDTRFIFSSQATSSQNYQLVSPKADDVYPLFDCYSSIGFNQWRYDNAVDANILGTPTLTNNDGIFNPGGQWDVLFKDDPIPYPISARRETFSETARPVTRFELNKGQQRTTLRQPLNLTLGSVYTLYSNTKAHNATFEFRVGRGRAGTVLEYYNFDTGRFASTSKADKHTYHKISPKNYFSVDEFKFKLHGHKIDTYLANNTQYYVEYLFPSHGFVEEEFAPWDESYKNPYVDVVRLEVCDNQHQILKNPNFLELQSSLLNNDFVGTYSFTDEQAKNAPGCEQEGLKQIIGWSQVNPLVTHGVDPTSREESVGLGYVKPVVTSDINGTSFADAHDGVILHASSVEVASSGHASISQTFALNDDFKNKFAYLPGGSVPVLEMAGNGQADNNATLMLKFETMASGQTTAANSGYLEISLERTVDGAFYQFSGATVGNTKQQFGYPNIPMKFNYSELDVWKTCSVPVILPADANRHAYNLTIKARGRTDAKGFINYGIRNMSFGKLEGWRTYMYNMSSAGSYYLSSNSHSRVTPNEVYSSLVFESPRYSTLNSAADMATAIDDSFVNTKNQLVQNFRGMEPTKTYRLNLKGTSLDAATIPGFTYTLKAKSRGSRVDGEYNVFAPWYIDSNNYSATNTVSKFSPFSNDGSVLRRTFPIFQKQLKEPSVKPTDWGLLMDISGTPQNLIAEDDIRANAGEYTLSMDVFNGNEQGGYFVLSSSPSHFYNWSANDWDSIAGPLPSYRGALSATYFLKLPSGENTDDFTPYTYPGTITLEEPTLPPQSDTTPDGLGLRGKFRLGAGVYGPNFSGGALLVKNLSLKGPGLDPNVDVWKEKYYSFDDQDWVPRVVSGTDQVRYSEAGGTARSFISTPTVITNMCVHGLDKDTEYQLNITDTSGGQYTLHEVALTDVSLVTNRGKEKWVRDASIFTSEPYADSHYNDYENGVVLKLRNNGVLSNPATALGNQAQMTNGFVPWKWQMFFNGSRFVQGDGNSKQTRSCGLISETWTNATHSPWLLRSFTLGEYGIEGGDEISFGWESKSGPTGDLSGYIAAEAKYGGQTYVYDWTQTSWVPGTERVEQGPSKITPDPTSTGGVSSTSFINYMSHTLSPPVVAPRFGANTKITVSFRPGGPPNTYSRDWVTQAFNLYRFTDATPGKYRVEGDTFLFPEFPRPEDTSLQSKGASGTPDELGQFLNRIQYFSYSAVDGNGAPAASSIVAYNNPMAPSPTGEKTFEEAVAMGAYLPSAGLWFGSGTYGLNQVEQQAETHGGFKLKTGILNTMGVVNSDGYIYRHPYTVSSYHDASAGFLASSVSSTIGGENYNGYGVKQNRYVLKVHKDDWRFLDYYMGGLGALGLHAIDYKETYNKLGTTNQLTHYRPTGAAQYTTGKKMPLYNVADPTQNPIFTLCNKKVTFPPGLHIDYDNTDVITIIWDINFMSERKL